jgi:hypothetical protein
MFCNQCGSRNTDIARYCSTCGSLIWKPNQGPDVGLPIIPPASQPAPHYPYAISYESWYDPEVAKICAQRPELIGVGGWLLWFCIVATVITPLFAIGAALSDPTRFDLFNLGFSALWIIAGIGLWRESQHALGLTKILLFIQLGLGILFFVFDVALRMHGYSEGIPADSFTRASEAGHAAGRLTGGSIIWLLYLKNSKRVKATFGRSI